jgi:hypothetical protein
MKKLIFPFLICLIWSVEISAQKVYPQILSSSGNSNQTNTMTIEWTLGELSITTISGPTAMITQGFHQPRYVITAINEISETLGKINVFPNPTSDKVNMNMTFDKIRSVHVGLTDLNGKLLFKKKYVGQNMNESMSFDNLPNGSYIMNFILDDNNSKQSFIILKTN